MRALQNDSMNECSKNNNKSLCKRDYEKCTLRFRFLCTYIVCKAFWERHFSPVQGRKNKSKTDIPVIFHSYTIAHQHMHMCVRCSHCDAYRHFSWIRAYTCMLWCDVDRWSDKYWCEWVHVGRYIRSSTHTQSLDCVDRLRQCTNIYVYVHTQLQPGEPGAQLARCEITSSEAIVVLILTRLSEIERYSLHIYLTE